VARMGSGLYEIANARNDERSKPKPPGSGPGRLREKPCFQMNRTKSIPQGLKPNADSIGFMPGINPRPTA
jgi:hypothetical protein